MWNETCVKRKYALWGGLSPSQLHHYCIRRRDAESALSHHNYRTRMALQHAQGDLSGKLLAWLLREVHHGTPAMSIRTNDGTMATSQLAIHDTFRDCTDSSMRNQPPRT
ncbi:hypothetical protein NDU88_001386 [Pleurodeles waltl]|uniref:Uncharacterized protein n=1 Tax=Pleurodeles waltl TaxID=8319 RepID=A0AAV7THN2_PLEWA|nr:hypothetical protein NDU88_001386 [Pleurodeles waltl]